jgi:hypothetical protein
MKEGLFLFDSIENSLLVCTNIKAAQKELVWVGDRERENESAAGINLFG